jgi:hypothetical protein
LQPLGIAVLDLRNDQLLSKDLAERAAMSIFLIHVDKSKKEIFAADSLVRVKDLGNKGRRDDRLSTSYAG